MLLARPQKSQYTEDEAAEFLGVSVDQLRSLIHKHVLSEEEAGSAAGLAVYRRSDLLLLRLLRTQQANA
ncbi:MAG TPA: MerR family transcriptional regulator [Bryobacteraceae bacterium]|nr:MerR family transcriptional regulator [Bryobacteraceae bacterium]